MNIRSIRIFSSQTVIEVETIRARLLQGPKRGTCNPLLTQRRGLSMRITIAIAQLNPALANVSKNLSAPKILPPS
jgi:hypothetical protein